MNATRHLALVLFLLFVASSAAASPDLKRTCVDASTQGQTLRDEGKLLEARAELLVCAQDACPAVVRKSCLEWLAEVEARTPSIVVRAVDQRGNDVTDATLTIDDAEYKLDGRAVSLNPGTHTITITEASGQTSEQRVLLTEREQNRPVTVQLGASDDGSEGAFAGALSGAQTPRKADQKYSVPVGSWVLGAVGLAGIGAFIYLQVASAKELDDLKKECPFGNCTAEQTEPGRRKARYSYVPLGVGAGAIVGAVTWGVVAWRKSKKANAQVALVPLEEGGGFLNVRGRF